MVLPQLQQRPTHRTVHQTTASKQQQLPEAAVAVASEAMSPSEQEDEGAITATASNSSALFQRFVVTAEVTVSKIFPAGLGWQAASIAAAGHGGFATDSLAFALSTGLGDAVGVLGGHCLYYSVKQRLLANSGTGSSSTHSSSKRINMTKELHTGALLGTAAFCSGTAWQPIVNALQGMDWSVAGVMVGTWVTCGTAFYAGLRIGRTLLPLAHVAPPTHANSLTDCALSVSIGGATGFFVGTDAAYLPDQNFLLGVVGITPHTPDVVGCALAGTSTSLGFVSAQTTLNMIYPVGKCWND
jgi:hypothetical protein